MRLNMKPLLEQISRCNRSQLKHAMGAPACPGVSRLRPGILLVKAAEKFGFVSGQTLVVPLCLKLRRAFTGCGKTKFFEGDGLQAVRK
jgi:hypothetical protein